MKRWLRDWALVDVIGLGLAALLTGSYVSAYRSEDPFGSLWPNVATEMFGVWLSVRIIGAWIDRRQKRTGLRGQLIGHLNLMAGHLEDLLPFARVEVTQAIRREAGWFERLKDHRFAGLSAAARSDSEAAMAAVAEIPAIADQLRELRSDVRARRRGIDVKHAGGALMSLRELAAQIHDGSVPAEEVATTVATLRADAESAQTTIGDMSFVRSFANELENLARLEQQLRGKCAEAITLLQTAVNKVLDEQPG